MIHKNIWSPDTCKCEIEYEWDDAQDENTRVHTVSNIIKACPTHAGILDKVQHFTEILAENQRKNRFLGEILESVEGAVDIILQEDGSVVKQLKRGLEYKWSFDTDRNLVVDLKGFDLTQKDKAKLLAAQAKFENKVKIL